MIPISAATTRIATELCRLTRDEDTSEWREGSQERGDSDHSDEHGADTQNRQDPRDERDERLMSHDLTVQGVEQARAWAHRGSGHRYLLARPHVPTVAAHACAVNMRERIREYPRRHG